MMPLAGSQARATDRLIDGLPTGEDEMEPAIREAVAVLQRTLVRFHPSFRFEERLAGRLRDGSGPGRRPQDQPGQVIPFIRPAVRHLAQPDERSRGHRLGGAAIASAAIASAAIASASIAGAVFAWRHARERSA